MQNKNLLYLAIIVGCVLVPTTIFAKDARFDDPVVGFGLVLPDSWSIEYPTGRGRNNSPALIAKSPDTGSSDEFIENLAVMIGKQPTEVDLDVLLKESDLADRGMKSAIGKYEARLISKESINEMPAIWKHASLTLPESKKTVSQLNVMIGHRQYVYILVFSSIPAEYENNEPIFRKIALSFKANK